MKILWLTILLLGVRKLALVFLMLPFWRNNVKVLKLKWVLSCTDFILERRISILYITECNFYYRDFKKNFWKDLNFIQYYLNKREIKYKKVSSLWTLKFKYKWTIFFFFLQSSIIRYKKTFWHWFIKYNTVGHVVCSISLQTFGKTLIDVGINLKICLRLGSQWLPNFLQYLRRE